MYKQGLGVEQSAEEASRWLASAAQRGIAQAQFNLAVAYFNGDGVAQDRTEAIRWLSRAAEQRYAAAAPRQGLRLD